MYSLDCCAAVFTRATMTSNTQNTSLNTTWSVLIKSVLISVVVFVHLHVCTYLCLCRWDNRQYLSWLGPIERFYCSPHSRLLSCHLLVPLRLKKGEDSLRFSIPDSKRNSTASADFALAGSGSHIIPLVHTSGHPEWPVWHHCTDNSPAHLTTHQIALLYYQY